jgi:hypothetical protein
MYYLTEDSINGIKIDEEIFQEEKCEWNIVHKESLINNLFVWIGEAIRGNNSDSRMMQDDLFELATWKDEYIFSNIATNDYVGVGDARFTDICKELLELNKNYVHKLIEVKIKVLVEYNSSVLNAQEVLDMAHVCFRKENDDSCAIATDYIEVTDYLSESFKKITK